jgi:protoheme IX farnesyltransferase
LFASQWHIDWLLFLSLVVGLTLVIASACVFNNYIDQDLDKQMERTKKRALPSGQISAPASIIFGSLLGTIGFAILSYTNWLTVGVVAVGFLAYVIAYGYAKRHTVYSTLIGTVPGGASIVAGYTAVTGQLDRTAAILFLIMLAWQMVHFYAIAIYRLKEYAAAKIPILAVKQGVAITKKHMLFYMILFIFAVSLLTWSSSAGYVYLVGALMISALWLQRILQGFSTKNNEQWARGVFIFSLVVLLSISALIALSPKLP